MHPASVAGLLAAASVVIATVAIIQHLRHYSAPAYQVHIVRILLMVPVRAAAAPVGARAARDPVMQVYSVQSWLALAYPSYRVELGTLRDWFVAQWRLRKQRRPPRLAQLRGVRHVPVFLAPRGVSWRRKHVD